MTNQMKIHFWGTRGSFPSTKENHMRYGGNTSCVSVETGQGLLVFDAGSGLAELGNWIRHQEDTGYKQGENELKPQMICIFLSHVHIDHVMGFYLFSPFFDSGREIILYGEEKDGVSIQSLLTDLIRPPYWPVKLADMPARIQFRTIRAGDCVQCQGVTVRTAAGQHPDGTLLFRAELGEKSLYYGLDCEMDAKLLDRLTPFCRDCDLLISDAQYLEAQLEEKKGWGHSSWNAGIRLKQRSGAKKVICTHYDWQMTDQELEFQEQLAQREDPDCIFAKEGMEIVL
ncbi:MAG: MBL fold metallo-hydrolase [Lachnospiraceae bacterium]|nr:MBL fold metallo-hydrolase [Lachnospiraceae bacterium]